MKNIIKISALSLITSAFLVGCGSSSDSTEDSSGSDILTGYFIDSPVANCEYTTSSGKKGRTDTNGKFEYKHGDKVKFYIGNLSLGECEPQDDGLVTPKNLGADETTTITLLRVLQALDSDNNPSNGITISEDIIKSLEKLSQKTEISEIKNDDELLKLSDDLADALDEDYDGKIDVDQQKAQEHFNTSMDKWESGQKPDDSNHGNANKGAGNSQGDSHANGNSSEQGHGNNFDLSQYPKSANLSSEVLEALAYMGNEERLAYDTYMTLYNKYNQSIKQFQNISSRSEIKHVGIVQDLVQRYNVDVSNISIVNNPVADKNVEFEKMPTGKYDIEKIQNLYNDLIAKGSNSKIDALQVGCMVEVTDVNDLDRYIKAAEASNATDVVEAFNVLRSGSYNHYWSFDRALKNEGVTDGCASLGADFAKTAEEYPSSNSHGEEEQGQGQGQGKGKGQGQGSATGTGSVTGS